MSATPDAPVVRARAGYSIGKEQLAGVLHRYGLYFTAKLVNKPAAQPLFKGCAADSEHGAPHDLIRSDQRLFWSLGRNRGRVNVGSAYRLFFDVVPLRASRTEGLSGQYTIGATDSYNGR